MALWVSAVLAKTPTEMAAASKQRTRIAMNLLFATCLKLLIEAQKGEI